MLYIFTVVWAVTLLLVYNNIRIERERGINRNKFPDRFHNALYQLSFSIPFVFFVEDDDKLTPKGKEIYDTLRIVGYDSKFTVRSYMTAKVLLLILGLLSAGTIILILQYSSVAAKYLLNIAVEDKPLKITSVLVVFSICIAVALIPDMMMKLKVKKALVADNKDIPILQIFIILMLRSNKTVPDILYALSKLDTSHKPHFELGYRIYLRNQQEGISYLKMRFDNTKFYDTFCILEDMGEYAKDDCIRILEGNLENIVEETTMIKRRNDVTKLIYTQASMVVPFATLLLLGAVPIVIMGMAIMSGGGLSIL